MPNDSFSNSTPGLFGSDADETLEKILKSITYIKGITEPRLVIMETWLIIDWFIRQILATGLNIDRISSPNFDPRYSILPNSTAECLTSLQEFIIIQKKLKSRPVPPRKNFSIRFSIQAMSYMRKNYPEIYKKIDEIEKNFIENNLPPFQFFNPLEEYKIISNTGGFRNVSDSWLESVSALDDPWFKHARTLNRVRNLAAHTLTSSKIFSALKIKEVPKNIQRENELIKAYCTNILDKLIGIK